MEACKKETLEQKEREQAIQQSKVGWDKCDESREAP